MFVYVLMPTIKLKENWLFNQIIYVIATGNSDCDFKIQWIIGHSKEQAMF